MFRFADPVSIHWTPGCFHVVSFTNPSLKKFTKLKNNKNNNNILM